MNFVADECVAEDIVARLRAEGHDVFSVREQQRGIDDPSVLHIAVQMRRVLLTQDLDFGELVYRQNLTRCGVVLIRLPGVAPAVRADRVAGLVQRRAAELANSVAVITPTAVRIRPPLPTAENDPV